MKKSIDLHVCPCCGRESENVIQPGFEYSKRWWTCCWCYTPMRLRADGRPRWPTPSDRVPAAMDRARLAVHAAMDARQSAAGYYVEPWWPAPATMLHPPHATLSYCEETTHGGLPPLGKITNLQMLVENTPPTPLTLKLLDDLIERLEKGDELP